MRPWESVARRAERAGAWSCRRRLLGWDQVRVCSARVDAGGRRCGVLPWVRSARGWRADGDAACGRASGWFGSITYFCSRMRILRGARLALPSGIFGPRDLAPLRRLASARALLTRRSRAAPALDMAGLLPGLRGLDGVVAEAPGASPGNRSVADYRNICLGMCSAWQDQPRCALVRRRDSGQALRRR
jgi:hypothetical protein